MDASQKIESSGSTPEAQAAWDPATKKQFDQMIAKIPVFLRSIAEKKVGQRAEKIVKDSNRTVVEEKDMIDAFFAETPFGFHGPMKCDMEDLRIDYVKYGHAK